MNSLLNFIQKKINKKILNAALWIIKRHVNRQQDLDLYTYNRTTDVLVPITWKARGITQSNGKSSEIATNDWSNLDNLVDYENKIVVDVGASLGATAQLFSTRASIVHAFEPHPRNYQFLLDQIKIRNKDNIFAYQKAVSNQAGKVHFFGRESHGIHSLGEHNKGTVTETFEVEAIRLDDFWKQNIKDVVGLLKIDVEGFELEVLQGAAELLQKKKIEAVLFEFSPRIHRIRKIEADAPIQFLNECGYKVYTLDGKDFEASQSKSVKICDLIAFPE